MKLKRKRLGQAALPFTLQDINGKEYSLGSFQGQWLVLVFHRHLG